MSEDPNARFRDAKDQIARAGDALRSSHKDLMDLRGDIQHARSRGKVQQEIWNCERALGLRDGYFSQSGQDAFLEENIFRGKRGGTFVEIGGYDGVVGSNCLFFEMRRGWQGVIVEPSPQFHADCAAARRAPCLQVAIGSAPGTAQFLEVREGLKQMGGLVETYDPDLRAQVEGDPRHKGGIIDVEVIPLAELLDSHKLQSIDYLSLDVEGAEIAILSTFPFERFEISAMTVENGQGAEDVPQLLAEHGFRRIDALGVDDVYVADTVLDKLRG
ncbi:MAG: FkbM family methyltransferase [Pseudomonadota bacterium]